MWRRSKPKLNILIIKEERYSHLLLYNPAAAAEAAPFITSKVLLLLTYFWDDDETIIFFETKKHARVKLKKSIVFVFLTAMYHSLYLEHYSFS